MDALFEQRVSARKFATTTVDPYGHGVPKKDIDTIGEKREKEFVEKEANAAS